MRARLAPREGKGDPQRDRRAGIGDVVDGVGQQGDAAGEDHHGDLHGSGDGQDDEGPLYGPDAAFGAGDTGGNRAVRMVVPMRVEQPSQDALAMPMMVVSMVVIAVLMTSVRMVMAVVHPRLKGTW